MKLNTPICIIGAGYFGTSVLRQLAKKGHQHFIATRRNNKELQKIQKEIPHLKVSTDNKLAAKKSKVIILTTKEKNFEEIANEIKKERENKLIISLGPTYSLKKLETLFGKRNIRLMSAVDPAEDIICYAADESCLDEDKKTISYIFGENTEWISEDQMAIVTTHALFRGLLNSFFDPLKKASINMGMEEALVKKILGRMLISTGREIEEGASAEERLKRASGGFNQNSFTLKLYKNLKPTQQAFESLFREAYEDLKKAEK